MASNLNKKKSIEVKNIRPVDALFDKYSASHQNKVNKVINWICIPVIVFAMLGFTTAIPFPHLGFLGQYNVYINWTSILIALSIYFYLKMSPMLSYLMLFIEFAMSYGVIQLDEWQKSGGPALGPLSVAVLITALIAQFIGQKIEGKRYSLDNSLKFQFYAPAWLLSLVLKKFTIKY